MDSDYGKAYFHGSLPSTKHKHRYLLQPQVAAVDQEERRREEKGLFFFYESEVQRK